MRCGEMTVAALSAALQRRELSAREAAQDCLRAIEERDGGVGAFLTVTGELALRQADEVDAARASGRELPPLAGVPMAVKDNICTEGVRTTCASRMLESFVPPYSAAVYERLRAQGAVLLGKLNMDEFAMGSTTESSYFHPTRNPRAMEHVPGGSSGGSAAAVAAGMVPFALGSDTGGSIRQPAAFCGVVGLKPTYGAVSRWGLVAFASSLDQIGPLTRTAEDAAWVLRAIAGRDSRDATSLEHDWSGLTDGLCSGADGLRVALPRQCFGSGVAPAVRQRVLDAASVLERCGAQVEEVSLPALDDALPAYYVMSSAEASSNLARFDGVRYGFRAEGCRTVEELYEKSRSQGFGAEVKRRILLGSFVLSAGYQDAYYKKALRAHDAVRAAFDETFSRFSLVLTPVAPRTAWKLGEKREDPTEVYLEDVFTVPVNLAGLPAVSLPCGQDESGLPVGAQLIAPHFGEPVLLRAAYTLEQTLKGGRVQ